jgi:hypothetical protein
VRPQPGPSSDGHELGCAIGRRLGSGVSRPSVGNAVPGDRRRRQLRADAETTSTCRAGRHEMRQYASTTPRSARSPSHRTSSAAARIGNRGSCPMSARTGRWVAEQRWRPGPHSELDNSPGGRPRPCERGPRFDPLSSLAYLSPCQRVAGQNEGLTASVNRPADRPPQGPPGSGRKRGVYGGEPQPQRMPSGGRWCAGVS